MECKRDTTAWISYGTFIIKIISNTGVNLEGEQSNLNPTLIKNNSLSQIKSWFINWDLEHEPICLKANKEEIPQDLST